METENKLVIDKFCICRKPIIRDVGEMTASCSCGRIYAPYGCDGSYLICIGFIWDYDPLGMQVDVQMPDAESFLYKAMPLDEIWYDMWDISVSGYADVVVSELDVSALRAWKQTGYGYVLLEVLGAPTWVDLSRVYIAKTSAPIWYDVWETIVSDYTGIVSAFQCWKKVI